MQLSSTLLAALLSLATVATAYPETKYVTRIIHRDVSLFG